MSETETVTGTCKNDWCDKPADPAYGHKAFEGYCEDCQDAIVHDQHIDELVGSLERYVKDARTAAGMATSVLAELMSNAVYDVEFAEGSLGGDARDELDEIGRKLRHVERCVAERLRILKEASAS